MVSSYLGSSNFEDYLGPADYNKFHPDHGCEWSVVMCWLWPEARSQAKPGQKKPGQAGPNLWPETAFGLAWILSKLEPAA